jgi:hypothetical protein
MLAFNRLRVDPGDGSATMDYRIEDGCVESRVVEMNNLETTTNDDESMEIDNSWKRLSPEELSSHVQANTVVARWLSRRMGIFPLVRACYGEPTSVSHEQESHHAAA